MITIEDVFFVNGLKAKLGIGDFPCRPDATEHEPHLLNPQLLGEWLLQRNSARIQEAHFRPVPGIFSVLPSLPVCCFFDHYDSDQKTYGIWGFPDDWGTPSHHPLLDGIFHDINQPFWGTPICGNHPIEHSLPDFSRRWETRLRPVRSC